MLLGRERERRGGIPCRHVRESTENVCNLKLEREGGRERERERRRRKMCLICIIDTYNIKLGTHLNSMCAKTSYTCNKHSYIFNKHNYICIEM